MAPLLNQLSLWPHQQAAIDQMRRYIAHHKRGDVEGSALVHMPTGSGKTGVIATLARCVPGIGLTLILAPRVALRQQLCRDVRSRFFEQLESAPPLGNIPKQVIELTGDREVPEIQDYDSTILVATIQKLHSMAQNVPQWDEIARHVELIMVDEGHYEPAASWSLVIRSFGAPKIIFTATPYRNDLKIFDINLGYVFSYTFHQAVEDRILRDVEVIPCKPTRNPKRFVADLLAFYDEKFGRRSDPKPRVIIRCDRREEIRQIADALKENRRDYIAIHETFSDDDGNPRERRSVPDPRTEPATFWIHQFKLLEGIDDPHFQVLALFEPLHNARSLVQQIGRIIRNPGRKSGMKGYVLDHSDGQQWELWLGFLKYDLALRKYGKKGLNLAIGEEWLASLFDAQPICTYLKDRFRIPLDFDRLDPRQDLSLPRMMNLRYKGKNFELEELCRLVEEAFAEEDRVFRRYNEERTIVFLYISFNNSLLLENAYFLEPRLGVTIIRDMEEMVAYYDSSGHVPIDFREARLGDVVDSDDLKKLFSTDRLSHLTSVSLRNSNLGPNSIRSRSINALDIQNTVSAFDDHAQICTTATGYSWEKQDGRGSRRMRRYIGFEKGRISEASQRCCLDDYEQWLGQVVLTLSQSGVSFPTFRRYAEKHVTPLDPTPRHILLDLLEVEDHYVTIGGPKEVPLEIEELSREIDPRGEFNLVANGQTCLVKLTYDPITLRYVLESSDLDRLYRSTDPVDKRGLVHYLNQEQSFRVIPETENLIYTSGQFYRPLFKVGKGFNPNLFDVCQILVTSPKLAEVGDEKGILPNQSRWSKDSLFGIIDRLGEPASLQEYFGKPDILVCDDPGTETADFILAETFRKRAVFIHAKASSNKHPFSASALHDVISQATKNINYLGMYNEATPPNLKEWGGAWPDNKTRKVAKRIRRGPSTGNAAWKQIRSIICHPLADREVWLFLGKILSKSQFEANLALDPPTAEAVQAAYLLRSALTNVASVGAKLRVFCYP